MKITRTRLKTGDGDEGVYQDEEGRWRYRKYSDGGLYQDEEGRWRYRTYSGRPVENREHLHSLGVFAEACGLLENISERVVVPVKLDNDILCFRGRTEIVYPSKVEASFAPPTARERRAVELLQEVRDRWDPNYKKRSPLQEQIEVFLDGC